MVGISIRSFPRKKTPATSNTQRKLPKLLKIIVDRDGQQLISEQINRETSSVRAGGELADSRGN